MNRTVFLLAMVLATIAPTSLHACVCPETGSIKDELQSSDAVFLGRVVALTIDTVSLEEGTFERMRATFKVQRRWKGPNRSRLDVWTCGDQVSFCTCGIEFKLGGEYVVFAAGRPLGSSSCNRTRLAAESKQLVAELEKLLPAAGGRITTR
jgi:hypothetical protein